MMRSSSFVSNYLVINFNLSEVQFSSYLSELAVLSKFYIINDNMYTEVSKCL